MPVKLFGTSILLVCCTTAALAQNSSPRPPYDHEHDAPQAVAARLASDITINGRLDEPIWQSAQPVTAFTQLDPSEGKPATERTEIRVLFDDDALYIGAWLYDRQPVRARLGRRDMSMSASDWLTIIFDTNHDHRSAFGFEINPAGVRRDQTRAGGREDDSWDPVWEAATTVTDAGWFAEIRIPFSQLRFARDQQQTWGLQIERQIARNQEFSVWSFTPRDQPGGAPRYGHLAGIAEVATGKKLEVLPYAVTRMEAINPHGNPFRSDHEYDADAGVDLKYRITGNHTLDATFNPDFGQVEADPAVINLTAFETSFAEKRPFFVEGSELFRFAQDGTNSLFYSRRIGKQPTLLPPYSARDVPDATHIIGAAKVTGRSPGGWAIGVLDAVTAREVARYQTPTGTRGEIVAEPATNYLASRLRRELRAGQTAIGLFAGAVNRDLGTEGLQAALRSAAYSGGIDFSHQWSQRTWSLTTFLAGTHVRGSRTAISATQRLPYHYYQRPDAEHLDYDTTRTSLGGLAANLAVSKRIGRHWFTSVGMNTITPGYEVSDLGFQRRADRFDVQLNLEFEESRPSKTLRSWYWFLTPLVEHNYDWDNISTRIFYGGGVQLLNYWRISTNFTASPVTTIDDRLTRGGPAAERPRSLSSSLNVSSDPRRRVVGSFGVGHTFGPAGRSTTFGVTTTFRPAPHWDLTIRPQFAHDISEAQYLQRVPDASATNLYGARYVFADLDQKTLAVEARLNYTFSPALSLQVWTQPFIAAGEFGEAKQLVAPRTYEFAPYNGSVPNLDFNVRSLRGNAVLRWEWRPGSTMYLAWQQLRSGFEPVGDFDFSRDWDALFQTRPDNVLLLKVSYWLNP